MQLLEDDFRPQSLACYNSQCSWETLVIIRTNKSLVGINFSCANCNSLLTTVYEVELADE
jgi:hypothetical protein